VDWCWMMDELPKTPWLVCSDFNMGENHEDKEGEVLTRIPCGEKESLVALKTCIGLYNLRKYRHR
jgi:hypothetical protein